MIGTAIGLNLLFHIPLEIGVIITAADVFLILALQAFGFRWIEAFVVAMLGVIAACFAVQIAMADPDWGAVLRGFAPTTDMIANPEMLYLALGILGATVMPHNLYLHSGLVQTRGYGEGVAERREAIKLATIDSTIALCLALVINASILILAAATFHRAGKTDVAELDQAHAFLAPLLGSTLAPTLFAIALLCCGLNSTITATLSGQIVMEGFLNLRIAPWLRRMVTRMIAIVPAVVVTIWAGEKATGQLLILSQVVLSLQLPFAVVPLVMFTASRAKMGPFVAPRWLTALAALTAAVIIALNIEAGVGFLRRLTGQVTAASGRSRSRSAWRPPWSFAADGVVSWSKARLILRLRRHFADGVDAQPAGGGQPLLRQEAALVVHLLGAFDPVAEIDVRQALPPGAGDVVEDHEGAERAAFLRRLEERIDHRQSVAEHVGQRHREQVLPRPVMPLSGPRRRYSMMRVSTWLSSTIIA